MEYLGQVREIACIDICYAALVLGHGLSGYLESLRQLTLIKP